jgi:hypothetical protein
MVGPLPTRTLHVNSACGLIRDTGRTSSRSFVNFNYGEFAAIKSQAGLNSYKISVKEWVAKTNAIGLKASQYYKLNISIHASERGATIYRLGKYILYPSSNPPEISPKGDNNIKGRSTQEIKLIYLFCCIKLLTSEEENYIVKMSGNHIVKMSENHPSTPTIKKKGVVLWSKKPIPYLLKLPVPPPCLQGRTPARPRYRIPRLLNPH